MIDKPTMDHIVRLTDEARAPLLEKIRQQEMEIHSLNKQLEWKDALYHKMEEYFTNLDRIHSQQIFDLGEQVHHLREERRRGANTSDGRLQQTDWGLGADSGRPGPSLPGSTN